MTGSTFSDAWHQVAGLRVGLLPTVRVHKQVYRGQTWYVLQDVCSEKYFRAHEAAYAFIGLLTPQRTVEEIWLAFCEAHPETAPSQDAVIQLLAQLHQMNLLLFRSDGISDGIFERYRKVRRKEKLTHLLAFLYFRLPIWNPERLLAANIGWMRWAFSVPAFVLWCVAIVLGVRAVLGNAERLWDEGQGLLATDNLIWLLLCLFLLKGLHELGHAVACRKYGGRVYTIGIMFVALMPLPYTDASASWSMRSRWRRAMIAAAGMYVELFIAALAAVVWAASAPGLVSALAFNLMIIGSVSSLVFNGNPLLKFDAYYILSDLTGLPNLYQRAGQQWLYVINRWLLGTHQARSPADGAYERNWYLGYGALSVAYRLAVMVIITLYMADISLALGVLMVLAMAWIWLLWPGFKLLRYLSRSGELRRNRARAAFTALGALGLVIVLLATWPMPQSLRAPGVVESVERSTVFARAGGVLVELHARSGERVEAGSTLLRFVNPALELDHELTGQQLIEVRWLLRRAVEDDRGDLAGLRAREDWLLQRLDELEARLDALVLRAPHAGVWVSDVDHDRLHTAFARGERAGVVIEPASKQFIGVVSQERASALFDRPLSHADLRFNGRTLTMTTSEQLHFIPYQRHALPSAALGLHGGGSIAVVPDSDGRMLAREPFFEVRARLPDSAAAELDDGALGVIRVQLDPAPPLQQLLVSLRQLLQSRYQL